MAASGGSASAFRGGRAGTDTPEGASAGSSDAISYLEGFIDYERSARYDYDVRTFNTERIRLLLHRLGDPHEAFRAVHVAGTNGKGSAVAVCSAVLRRAGYRVGMYTSPHLVSFRERIRVDGVPISEDDLQDRVERLRRVIPPDRAAPSYGTYSFFEVYTALAFLHFALSGVDVAVVEVGLGGRLDATNVVRTLVSAILPIALDHADKLGGSLSSIAAEKAAIIREGGLAISSPQQAEAADVIRRFAAQRGARLLTVAEGRAAGGADFSYEVVEIDERGCTFDLRGRGLSLERLRSPLAGLHQPGNCATAAAACIACREAGLAVPDEAVRDGLSEAVWPGRFQVLEGRPTVVLDSAHNPAAARALRASLEALLPGRPVTFVFGACSDKDVQGVLDALSPLASRLVATAVDLPRSLPPDRIAAMAAVAVPGTDTVPTVGEAIDLALSEAGPDGLVCVTGSIYVVGEALCHLAGVPPYGEAVRRSLAVQPPSASAAGSGGR